MNRVTSEDEGRTVINVEILPRRVYGIAFGVYFLGIIGCIIVGLLGPSVYITNSATIAGVCSSSAQYYDSSCTGTDLLANTSESRTWHGKFLNLSPLSQELIITFHPFTRSDVIHKEKYSFFVEMYGKTKENDWEKITLSTHSKELSCSAYSCESIILAHEPFITFIDYAIDFRIEGGSLPHDKFLRDVRTNIQIKFFNTAYTAFELWFRLSFILILLVVTSWYIFSMWKFPFSVWGYEQKWLLLLLGACVFYNNPLFPLKITIPEPWPLIIHQIFQTDFICLLLLFFLLSFGRMLHKQSLVEGVKTRSMFNTVFKVLLVFGIFICTLTLNIWMEMSEKDDPTLNTDNHSGYMVLQIVFYSLVGVYGIWLIVSLLYTYQKITIVQMKRRWRILFSFSMTTVGFVLVALLLGFFDPDINNAAEFLSVNSILTLYIITLSFLFVMRKGNSEEMSNMLSIQPMNGAHVYSVDFEDDTTEDENA